MYNSKKFECVRESEVLFMFVTEDGEDTAIIISEYPLLFSDFLKY
jgi:hypothetical protein